MRMIFQPLYIDLMTWQTTDLRTGAGSGYTGEIGARNAQVVYHIPESRRRPSDGAGSVASLRPKARR